MAGKVDYKGEKATLVMMGRKQKVAGWRGELFVAVIHYGDLYDVVPDSTDSADVDDLPEVKTFSDKSDAISHFMKLENNKVDWK